MNLMNENDLKRYTVILDDSSGVLFQPLDETKTYILSAKHVFYKDVKHHNGPDTKKLKDRINYRLSTDQKTTIEIEIKKGVNYYEHDDADAAILVLDKNLGFDQIFIDERTTGFDGFNLTGYPVSKRTADDKYDKHKISDLISYSSSLITLRLVVNHLDHMPRIQNLDSKFIFQYCTNKYFSLSIFQSIALLKIIIISKASSFDKLKALKTNS